MEIHVVYKLDSGEELPGTLTLKPNDIERLKKMYPTLRAVSVITAKELEDIPDKIKNRLTK